jgi:hypothetical protein
MSTGVHDTRMSGTVVPSRYFLNRESIHVGSQEQQWPGLFSLDVGDDSGLAYFAATLDILIMKGVENQFSSHRFLKAQFRKTVDLSPQASKLFAVFFTEFHPMNSTSIGWGR